MNITESVLHDQNQTQQFHRQYGVNAILPEINWNELFKFSKLNDAQRQALDVLYLSAVPLALKVFEELNFDVFSPVAYQPQGLGLFEKLAQQEQLLIQSLQNECKCLNDEVRHQIWSMLLRGGAVVVFKAWLGKVKTGETVLDMTQFDELSDLLFIKTSPTLLAERLAIDPHADHDHIFLMYENDLFLDHFNSLQTAALFVDLGVYDAAFLSLRDDNVAEYLKSQGQVTQDQIEDLKCALNPLGCPDLIIRQDCIA